MNEIVFRIWRIPEANNFPLKQKEIRLGSNKKNKKNLLELRQLCVEKGFLTEVDVEMNIVKSKRIVIGYRVYEHEAN